MFARLALASAIVLSTTAACLPSAMAVEPALGSLQPNGFQAGAEFEFVMGGARLGDAKEILFYSPGFTVESLEPVNDGAVKAKVKVDPSCRIGIHALRLRTATGVSNLRTFTVGRLPVVNEVEPNNDFKAPQAIAMNSTVHGYVENEDMDHFVVEAKKGERITAELEGLRLGNTFFDPYLAILNSARFELARSDDAALLNQDCLASVVAPEDGQYIIQIRECSYGGNGECKYRLHVGNIPRPLAVFPPGGRPGETIQVRWIGDVAGDFDGQIALPTDESQLTAGAYPAFAETAQGLAPSANMVRVIDIPSANEDPNVVNDGFGQAPLMGAAPLAINGIIEKPGDQDFFKFTAKAGQQLDFRVYARKPLRSPLDSVMNVYNDKVGVLGSNDDSAGPDSYMRIGIPADGEYVVYMVDQLRQGGPQYVYRIEITEVKPKLTMIVPERQQYIPTTLTVHKNNRMAIMINAARENFGGVLNLELAGLPAGLVVPPTTVAADRGDTVVFLSAGADAQLGGGLVDVIGRPADANLPIVGRIAQRTMLVRGDNNVDVWGHDATKLATVLADEIPYKIEAVVPKAPLPRNGNLDIKVVATRAEGYKAPINVFLLYNPGGVGSSGSVTIPEGQNEATIPLTAAGNAPVANWDIVVIGRAGHINGAVECSSALTPLKVVDQFYNLAFEKAAAELGKDTEVVIHVEKKAEFAGQAKAELLGLPAGVTSEAIEFNKDTADLVFKVKIDAMAAKPGKYPFVCRTIFQHEGEPVTHTLGGGEIRVDAPLPPKPNAPPPPPAAAPMPMPEANAPPPKRLTRLEQLRLEKEQQKAGDKK